MSATAAEDPWRLPLHVVVRDYPETTAVFRARGVDLAERGGAVLEDVVAERERASLQDELEATIRWRRRP